MALCRSSNDSLIWSARRNNCGGLVAIVMGVRCRVAEAEVPAMSE
jgi:hypothetical protein